mgnify:CR=1 FL=1
MPSTRSPPPGFGIITRHILPNSLGPIVIIASLDIGSIVLTAAALSFLGLGIRPPVPSWGGLMAEALEQTQLWVKDDGRNPTASFKDRASAIAVVKAQERKADIITTAKGLTNGVIPMGAVLVQEKIHDAIMQGPEHVIELFHGYTYSGHPVAAAAGLAVQPTWVAFTPWTTLEDYLDMLDWVRERGLSGDVPPVQFAIRLLVPPHSRLLETASPGRRICP